MGEMKITILSDFSSNIATGKLNTGTKYNPINL